MKRISSFTIIFVTLCVLIGVITTVTIMKINKTHEEKLIYAMQSKVEYYAKRCFLENNCKGEVYLDTLYEKEYLEELYHPVTKERINPNTKINFDGKKITINW